MSPEQELTYCKRSCGNNMHVKCMKMYAEFQRSSASKVRLTPGGRSFLMCEPELNRAGPSATCVPQVVCPLCRQDWGSVVRHEPFGGSDGDAAHDKEQKDR
jgi:hypothetical protein